MAICILMAICHKFTLALRGISLRAHGGLRRPDSRVLGGPGDTPIGRGVQRGIEEPHEAPLDEHPAGMQRRHDILTKQNRSLVLLGRWSPKVRGQLSQRADSKMAVMFVDGQAGLAGGKIESELKQRRHDGCRVRRSVGISYRIQIRDGGGRTLFVRSHICWGSISIRRGVRDHDECGRLVGGRNGRVKRFVKGVIIRGRHGY